jgi:predicted dehydrogenase
LKSIRIGVIGLGVVGQRLIKGFNENPNTVIGAVCDRNEELARNTAMECGDIPFFTNYQTLIEKESIDLVYVAVPPAYHYEVAMAALKNKKHVLCEKPLANSLEEAEEMWRTAEEKGVVHAIHFPVPYSSAVTTIKKLLQEDAIGELRRISLHMHFDVWPRPWQQTPWIGTREQGGFIREILPHYVQLIHHFFGNVEISHSQVEYPSNAEESEIGLMALMSLENGVKLLIDGLVGQAEREKIQFIIHGTKQSIVLEDWRKILLAKRGEVMTELDINRLIPSDITLIDECVKAINGEKAFIVNFKDGYEIQKVLENVRTT